VLRFVRKQALDYLAGSPASERRSLGPLPAMEPEEERLANV
jgi:hypothetical protein